MPKDKSLDDILRRLGPAVQAARLSLQYSREARKELIELFAGPRWSNHLAEDKRRIVNLISLYVSIVGKNLIPKNPRVMFATIIRALKPTLDAMESWANKETERMNLEAVLKRWVTDALFSYGVLKIGLASPSEAAAMAWTLGAGQAFARTVDNDDFVFDVHARSFEECAFIGHRYRVPLEVVKNDSRHYSKRRKELVASRDEPYNQEGDERINLLGRGLYGDATELEDMVDLWEIYLPRQRTVITIPDADIYGAEEKKPLRVQNWIGPDMGPYHILAYGIVPGSALPKGPLQDLADMDIAANESWRKALRMTERTKVVTVIGQGADADAKRLEGANDGEIIQVNNPQAIMQLTFGSEAIQPIEGMAEMMGAKFKELAGNLDMLGGLAAQSETLGQDRMLNASASRQMNDLQDQTTNGVSRVYRALGWFWWNDPSLVQRSLHKVGSAEITRQVFPKNAQVDGNVLKRWGRFEDLDIRVDPYSLRHQTPQEKMAALDQMVTQVVIPLAALLQQQGIVFDANAWLKIKAEYGDLPELLDILSLREPPVPQGGGQPGGEPGMPQNTTRTYERKDTGPKRTQQGDTMNRINQLMGVNPGGSPNGQMNGVKK